MIVFNRVTQFNKQIIGIDRKEIKTLDKAEAMWLSGALEEERLEFAKAWEFNNIPGQIDALIDSMYFAIGGLVRLGLEPVEMMECFEAVHEANMTKKKGRKQREVMNDLDATKPEGWTDPVETIKQIINERNV